MDSRTPFLTRNYRWLSPLSRGYPAATKANFLPSCPDDRELWGQPSTGGDNAIPFCSQQSGKPMCVGACKREISTAVERWQTPIVVRVRWRRILAHRILRPTKVGRSSCLAPLRNSSRDSHHNNATQSPSPWETYGEGTPSCSWMRVCCPDATWNCAVFHYSDTNRRN